MKAFVIKNKEGKYLRGTYGKNGEYCWTEDIVDAMTYGFNEFVPQPIENCMLVPITMVEGDLEQQLAEKDNEISALQERAIIDMQMKEMLELQVATIRMQICNMARKKIVEATCYDTEEEVRNVIYDLNASEALEILDQIEKGE